MNPTFEETKVIGTIKYWQIKKFQVDVDKLDYLKRDSYYTGIIKSNYDRIIFEARIVKT